MLECGQNYKETMSQMCRYCGTADDKNHRLDKCSNFSNLNRANDPIKNDFAKIHSENNEDLESIIADIQNVWEIRYANGRMRKLI